MIARRMFLAGTGAVLLGAPLAAEAQKAPTARVGWLGPEFKSFTLDPFRQALKELGWVEGGNLAIEQRYGRGRTARYPELAAELIRLKPDALVTDGGPATRAAQQATATIPIVFVAGDPVAQGFVASLSRPGRNLTGISIIAGGLNPKRIQLLRETVPGMARLAVLQDRSAPGLAATDWPAIETACKQLGIQLTVASVAHRADELDEAFALAVKERAGGVLVLPSALFSSQTRRIVSLAAKTRLPTIYEHRQFVEAGGLMSYGPSLPDVFRGIAVYVDKILKGAKAADLPVEQPTKFDLVINLKTARTLGLRLPSSVLERAAQIIDP